MILPDAALGVLGGGQLGRMFAMAARSMGYRVITWDPDPSSPARDFSTHHLSAGFDDEKAISFCLDNVQAITTEFENVPVGTLEKLSKKRIVLPDSHGVGICQDRIREKTFLRQCGFPVPAFQPILHPEDLDSLPSSFHFPALLKKSRLGYDGKGQRQVRDVLEAVRIYHEWGNVPCILEEKVPFLREVSVILGRTRGGEIRYYPVSENIHREGVLELSAAPAQISPELAGRLCAMAGSIAEKMEYAGVLAVEYFMLSEEHFLVNELAPRPHNSGHFTLDGCMTSQFEQQVRILCDLPLGETDLIAPSAMGNLMGDLWSNGKPDFGVLLSNPRVKLYLYGKSEARPGRKMGHFTLLARETAHALEETRSLLQKLRSPGGAV
ncbi:5-(carboxyamino)imidazole ribonucleotide synthase [Leptospirillum ferriphilum]|jgi:5-(carboxyamino)imidazole ribonucleotide synthase|uniref:N5-carboxyaminoimidazole ribonucleotide synthase n=1 Tax=Leptospirillum ferriphilum YSK TaxID=1441628 RepID=A0A059XPS1_9BACT|nr:5-(carboxyamino)imidazole ribonucleotide synthase [Leptospirillum ferriphilum]AIA30574.1 phosphoribosylaminoimidazole carboxylase [Leptospirillum ferriphilum YSK]EAY55758.1 MAG: phosphoribosylaminoimidazole carboxylase, ATPase subunit [Leptospirillum rubarum]OOH75407.1 5-(carboxyamino)imidazole ribonucleotide synthase [Leptospirillum ferriphilum]